MAHREIGNSSRRGGAVRNQGELFENRRRDWSREDGEFHCRCESGKAGRGLISQQRDYRISASRTGCLVRGRVVRLSRRWPDSKIGGWSCRLTHQLRTVNASPQRGTDGIQA